MDNRIFNVNGGGEKLLRQTLNLAFEQGGFPYKCVAWKETKENGLIFCWSDPEGSYKLPIPLGPETCADIALEWLKSDFAKTVDIPDSCQDIDHDGHNTLGWNVYVEHWGHVGNEVYSICAIRPCYMWHGK